MFLEPYRVDGHRRKELSALVILPADEQDRAIPLVLRPAHRLSPPADCADQRLPLSHHAVELLGKARRRHRVYVVRHRYYRWHPIRDQPLGHPAEDRATGWREG